MIVKYFEDTDTLFLQLNDKKVAETKDFDMNTLIDVDESGHLVGITIEHAKKFVAISDFSFQRILKKSA